MIFQVPGSREVGALPLPLASPAPIGGHTMRQMTVAVLLAAFTVGCATTGSRLDTSKPLWLKEGTFRQDGQPLLLSDVEEAFEKHPYTRTRMDGYQAKKWTGMILGYAGGALIGWNVSDNLLFQSGDVTTKNWTPSLVGLGAVALAIPFGLMAQSQMDSAVESYNKSLSMTGTRMLDTAVPFIAVLPQRQGGNQCFAGVTMSF